MIGSKTNADSSARKSRANKLPETLTDILRAANAIGVSAVSFQVEGSPVINVNFVIPSAHFSSRVFSAIRQKSVERGWEIMQGFVLAEEENRLETSKIMHVDYAGPWTEDAYRTYADVLSVAGGYSKSDEHGFKTVE